jgi:hypothetical protein
MFNRSKKERKEEVQDYEKLTEILFEIQEEEQKSIFSSNDFIPGGIHTEDSIQFWEKELQAGEWVLNLLKDGYILPLQERLQIPYEEDNNLSARKNMAFVRQQVEKWRQQGIIEMVDQKPACVSPLTVVERKTEQGGTKRRLCWDGSRHVNKALKVEKVSLAHLQVALEITRENDLQTKYDLTSAYFHIKIFPPHTKFLGAKFTDDCGKTKYFVFRYMPFGLATAVHVITKLFKPVQAYFARQGIRHTIFIDDGRMLAETAEESTQKYQVVRQTLRKAGWQIEESKSDPAGPGTKIKEYLGFIINTEDMTVHLTEMKKEKLKKEVQETAALSNRVIPIKKLAQSLGLMVSASPALGTLPLVFARRGYSELEEKVQKQGWKARIKMPAEVATDFRKFISQIEKHDGAPITSAATAVSVLSIIGEPTQFLKAKVIPNHTKTVQKAIWCGDASQWAVCAYSIKDESEFFLIKKFTEEEQKLSSGHRELLALLRALEEREETKGAWNQKTTLYWLTDSENLVTFLRKGSKKRDIQEQLLAVLERARALNVKIEPIHLRREDPRIQLADGGSKIPDSDDWSIDDASFQKLNRKYGPFTIDLFAAENNAKVKRFYSEFFSQSSKGVNAFCHSWDGEMAWVCPPIKCIINAVFKIEKTEGSGVLLIPKWPTARFWPIIFPDGTNPRSVFKEAEEIQPWLTQNQEARSVLSGKTKFTFVAFIG